MLPPDLANHQRLTACLASAMASFCPTGSDVRQGAIDAARALVAAHEGSDERIRPLVFSPGERPWSKPYRDRRRVFLALPPADDQPPLTDDERNEAIRRAQQADLVQLVATSNRPIEVRRSILRNMQADGIRVSEATIHNLSADGSDGRTDLWKNFK